jgi:hypothetical protein
MNGSSRCVDHDEHADFEINEEKRVFAAVSASGEKGGIYPLADFRSLWYNMRRFHEMGK